MRWESSGHAYVSKNQEFVHFLYFLVKETLIWGVFGVNGYG